MSLLFLATFVILVGAASVLASGTLIGIALAAARLRRQLQIAVRPVLEPTGEEDLPSPLKQFVGRAAPILVSLGFKPIASVHAPRFGTTMRWTQVLFVEPEEGHRASVICYQEGRLCFIQFSLATEFEDGTKVLTQSPDGASTQINVADQVGRHGKAVAELGRPPGGRLVPSPGSEVAWLSSKAAIVAASMANKAGFWLAPDGEGYVLTWRAAFRMVLRRIKNRLRPRSTRKATETPVPQPTVTGPAGSLV